LKDPTILRRLIIIWVTTVCAIVLGCALWAGRLPAADNTPTPSATSSITPAATPAASAPAAMSGWLDAASLPAMRWPDFRDYQAYVRNFYAQNGGSLAWLRDNEPTPAALAIIAELENADAKGLRAEDYDGGRWSARVTQLRQTSPPPTDADRASFDLALTVCLMRYISDLHIGRINPKTVNFALDVEHKKYDLPTLLHDKFVNASPSDVPGLIADVEPPFQGYQRALKALQLYEGLASKGAPPQLPVPAKAIGPGQLYPGLPQLVQFLRLVGDLAPDAVVQLDPPLYQQPVVDAVKSFQGRHGLETDGRLGAGTVKAINVPLSWRAEQLRLALERWRWRPTDFPRPPIVVNIPEFELRGLGPDYTPEIKMRVVVGKAFHHRTPVFTGNLSYVVFRPYWNVPLSIQRNELVPKIQRDRGYLAKGNYEVTNGRGTVVTDGVISDDVLAKLRAGQLFVRQKPGPKNSLGLVKFIFPNDNNVYLHDTPSVALFARARRDFSHGCIRVQDPTSLAVWVLRGKPGWDRDRVIGTMKGTTDNLIVTLDKPIPVLILYGTAVAPSDGKIYFYDDIYGYDAELEKVLSQGYPYP